MLMIVAPTYHAGTSCLDSRKRCGADWVFLDMKGRGSWQGDGNVLPGATVRGFELGGWIVHGSAFGRAADACRRCYGCRCAMGTDDPEGKRPLQRPGEWRLQRTDAGCPACLSKIGRSEADRTARRRHVGPYAGRTPVRSAVQHGQSGRAERQAAAFPSEPQRRTAEAAGIADHTCRYPRIR